MSATKPDVLLAGSARSDAVSDRQIICADNLALMSTLPDACCQLIYADPPFMTGQVRTHGSGNRYDDRWPGIDDYMAFLAPRLAEMRRLLDESGTLYVHLDWRSCHHVRIELDRIFGPDQFLNEIIWSYRTGGRSKRYFARKHDNILVYARRAGKHVFNVQRDGQFRTDGLNVDDKGRRYKSTRNGRLYFHDDGPAMTDVWEIPFLSTVSRERTGYPSQKPMALLERIIRASSNPGDRVADFFCGSGTALAAAARLDRTWLGCDSSSEAVAIATRRLANVPLLLSSAETTTPSNEDR